MGCSSCGPSRFSIESIRRWKAESNTGCCNNQKRTCSTPSLAEENSPLWLWEQKYGKLLTTVAIIQDEWGHTVQKVEKTICEPEVVTQSRHGCCSLKYRLSA